MIGASRRAISASRVSPASRAAASNSATPWSSTPGRAIHNANTNGKPVQRDHSSPKSQTNSKPASAIAIPRSPINSTASAGESSRRGPDRQRQRLRRHAEPLLEQNPHQRGAGARSLVQRQRADFLDRHAAKQLHAPHRAVAGNAGVGDDRIALPAGVLDRRDHRHVQPAGGQGVGQPARDGP